jgi:hypothetical protein
LLDARGAIDALTHRREQLEQGIVAMIPDSPWSVQVGAAAVPARYRHDHRCRLVRRDRRLRAVRPRRAADELHRARPVREHDRPATPARVDHQDRGRSRAQATRRGRVALPRPAERRARAHRPPTRPAPGGDRGHLVSSAAATSHLDTTGSTRQAPHECPRGLEAVEVPSRFEITDELWAEVGGAGVFLCCFHGGSTTIRARGWTAAKAGGSCLDHAPG